jgi:hypothetical protein
MNGFNEMPTPYRELGTHEYISLSKQIPSFVEYRQVPYIPNKPICEVYINWYRDFGIANVYPSNWKLENDEVIWERPIIYLYLGCNHKTEQLSYEEGKKLGINYQSHTHVYKCKLCGVVSVFDSSD